MTRKLLGFSILAATFAVGAHAADAPVKYVDPLASNGIALVPAGDTVSQLAFAYADRDADLYVSWEEYRNRAMRLFANIDTNGDGIMEVSELAAFAGPTAKPAPFDISIATYNAVLRKYFDDADKNKDGALTPAEWHDVVRPSNIANQIR